MPTDRFDWSLTQPLTSTHVVPLLSVVDKRQRKSLQQRAAKEGWSTRELKDEIKKLRGRRSAGGRPPRRPKDLADALVQVVKFAETWQHWYDGLENHEDDASVALDDLPDAVRKELAAATRQMEKLKNAAQQHLGHEPRKK